MEILNHYRVIKHFATNIKIESSPFLIESISDLDTLKTWAHEKKGPKLYVFDEVGRGLRRRSPMTSLNIKVIDEFQTLRKPKLSFIAITIDPQYVDNAILGEHILDGSWIKPVWKEPRLALYRDLLEDINKRFRDIPKTSIGFDTFSTARFTEHGPTLKPKIKDSDKSLLWDWSHGKTSKEVGLHPMQLNRLTRKYVKESLEQEYHASQ